MGRRICGELGSGRAHSLHSFLRGAWIIGEMRIYQNDAATGVVAGIAINHAKVPMLVSGMNFMGNSRGPVLKNYLKSP